MHSNCRIRSLVRTVNPGDNKNSIVTIVKIYFDHQMLKRILTMESSEIYDEDESNVCQNHQKIFSCHPFFVYEIIVAHKFHWMGFEYLKSEN